MAKDAGVGRLVITHFSARHSEQAHRLVKEAEAVHPAVAAEDGLSLELTFRDDPAGA